MMDLPSKGNLKNDPILEPADNGSQSSSICIALEWKLSPIFPTTFPFHESIVISLDQILSASFFHFLGIVSGGIQLVLRLVTP